MSRFLSNLVQRAMGQPSTLMPRLTGRYETIRRARPEANPLEAVLTREVHGRGSVEPMPLDVDEVMPSSPMTQRARAPQAGSAPASRPSSPSAPLPLPLPLPSHDEEIASTLHTPSAAVHRPLPNEMVHKDENSQALTMDMGQIRRRPVDRIEMDLNASPREETPASTQLAADSITPRGAMAVMALLAPSRQMPPTANNTSPELSLPETEVLPTRPLPAIFKHAPQNAATGLDEPGGQRQGPAATDNNAHGLISSTQGHHPHLQEDREDTRPRTHHSGLLLDPPRTRPPMAAEPLSDRAVAQQAAAPPTVHVTIGRIELRAAAPAPAPAASRQPAQRPTVSLRDYLERRNAPGRR